MTESILEYFEQFTDEELDEMLDEYLDEDPWTDFADDYETHA